ncbi:alpha/beta fold hydrolase [Actinomarinicola tropica]|nr:alpha/beta hydrolase [Actinomarinicola tropica]
MTATARPAPRSTAPAVRAHEVRVGALRLHVRDVGEPDALVVVVLHGIMGHAREWDPVVEALASRGRRVLAIEQRGHGRSDHAGTYDARSMAADVLGVLDVLGVRRADLVGHSMGGMIGMVLAAAHPERIRHLALLDVVPDAIASPDAHELAAWMAQLAEARYTSVDEAVAVWLAGDPFAHPVHMRRYVEHCLREEPDGQLAWRFDGARLGRFVTDGVSAEQLWDAALRLSEPPLLVRGEHSPFVTHDAAVTFADRTGACVVTIPHAAHDLGVERPEAVVVALDEDWAALR